MRTLTATSLVHNACMCSSHWPFRAAQRSRPEAGLRQGGTRAEPFSVFESGDGNALSPPGGPPAPKDLYRSQHQGVPA
jgi:hypothetical protein